MVFFKTSTNLSGLKPTIGSDSTSLYLITKAQYKKEKQKFFSKFGALDSKRAELAKSQNTNKEILSSSQFI